ncbi:MAG: LysE family translocator, partial [Alphaproteobacteria bacterium]|nr:LysE family translocator [Alphaproteobacteria bacterium]
MTAAQLLLASMPFFSFFLVASITPGPNNFMVAASGMNYGYKRTLPHIAGVVTGFCSLLLLCMLGIG